MRDGATAMTVAPSRLLLGASYVVPSDDKKIAITHLSF